MPRIAPSVDQYLAAQPARARAALERVRAAVRKAVPEAAEAISYGIPAFKLPGGILLYFAGWKEHVAVYPATAGVVALGDAVAPYLAGKGTLRFPLSERLPVGLVGRVARVRAGEVAARVLARKVARKARAPKRRPAGRGRP
jgi:uncharacterized protein YdhG (YjbR/CyaY superfamily)